MSNTATSIGVGIYKGGWNCPNKVHWSIIVTAHGYYEKGKVYNLINDGGRLVTWREVMSNDGPLKNTTLLGIVHTSVSSHCPKTIVDYVQRLAISPIDNFNWVIQVVTQLDTNSIASTDLEEDELVLHLRNVEHQHPGGTQVCVQQGFPNVSYRTDPMSRRCRYGCMVAGGQLESFRFIIGPARIIRYHECNISRPLLMRH
ncbi:hypothetical protein H4582DRAFT_1381888 [Lactarius indigo]|nr:hypothetical protein H4582DRAFT_1381888 [Lactarius indigo]